MEKEQEVEEVLLGEEREEFQSLLHLGEKTEKVTIFGHNVTISTLNVWEELQVAEIVKRWVDTPGYSKAYKAAVVGAALDSIDGEPFYTPLTPADEEGRVRKKFEMLKNYYPAFIDKAYEEVTKMERSLTELLEKLGK